MHRRKLWLFAGAVLLALALTATGSAKVNGPASQNRASRQARSSSEPSRVAAQTGV